MATDRQCVGIPIIQVLRDVDPPARITIRPTTDETPIEMDHRIAHRTITFEIDRFALPFSGRIQMQAIPSNPRHIKERIAIWPV